MGIVAAGNTYNPCLLILVEKGYRLPAEQDGEGMSWRAEKEDRCFVGFSPPELLGVVSLWERFGEDRNRQKPDLIDEVLEAAED